MNKFNISEEEIEKASRKFHEVNGGYHPDFGKGAKWAIDRLNTDKSEEYRKELDKAYLKGFETGRFKSNTDKRELLVAMQVDFINWMFLNPTMNPLNYDVDEFLNIK